MNTTNFYNRIDSLKETFKSNVDTIVSQAIRDVATTKVLDTENYKLRRTLTKIKTYCKELKNDTTALAILTMIENKESSNENN